VCMRKFLSENLAIGAQFISSNLRVVHPVSDARITDKTCSTNGFIKPLILPPKTSRRSLVFLSGLKMRSFLLRESDDSLRTSFHVWLDSVSPLSI
jgi:hypothetical protein